MPDAHSSFKKKRTDTSIGINIEIKSRLCNLDFIRKSSYNEILKTLMDFYEENKPQFEKWKKKKK